MLTRRGFFSGLAAAIAAPAIVRAGLIMPIKPGLVPSETLVTIPKAIVDCWIGDDFLMIAHPSTMLDLKAQQCTVPFDLFRGKLGSLSRFRIVEGREIPPQLEPWQKGDPFA